MRDQHRPKQDLIAEVVGLRKQVADLKDAAVARWRAEQAVRHSEEQYRALVDHAPAGICRLTAEGEFLQVNATFAELLGYENRTEALDLGQTFGLFATQRDRDGVLRAFAEADEIRALPVRLRRADNTLMPVRLSGRRVPGADGEPAGMVVIVEADDDGAASRDMTPLAKRG